MKRIVLFLAILSIISCSSNDPQIEVPETEAEETLVSWSIPEAEVLGPYAPFPLVTNSSFVSIDQVGYQDNHLMALISLGANELRAYPNAFFGLYEVINNEFEDKKFAITHCPQTGSTIGWDRIVDDEVLTIRASGFLFNENLMPTDIETGTIWSQMLMRGVRGPHDYVFHKTYNVVETDWKTVREHFPQAKVYNEVVNNATINVETEPTNRDFYRYGILTGADNTNVHIFDYGLFDQEGLKLMTATISGKKVITIGNKNLNFISSYFIENNREYLVGDSNSFTFKDNLGNVYNGMGLVIEGPDKDMQLESPKAYAAAWVAWQDFFENFVIYE